jgi:hypothetical protein
MPVTGRIEDPAPHTGEDQSPCVDAFDAAAQDRDDPARQPRDPLGGIGLAVGGDVEVPVLVLLDDLGDGQQPVSRLISQGRSAAISPHRRPVPNAMVMMSPARKLTS